MDHYKIQLSDGEFKSELKALAGRLENPLPAWQDVGEYMLERTRSRFRDGKGPDGVAWTPKSQTTLDAYAARGDGRPPKPLIGATKRLSSEINYGASAEGVVIGSSLIYAAVMQLGAEKGEFGSTSRGGSIPWGDIPARPFLGIDRDEERNILDIFEEHISGDTGAATP